MKIITTIFLSFLTFYASAQTDKEAEKLIDRISKRYKNFKTIKADFIYAIESKAEKINEKQKGTIIVKSNKFRLDIADQTIICDNKTIWTYSKEVNEVQINYYKPKNGAIKLDDIFTMYNKGFICKHLENIKEAGRELTVIDLTPKDKKKSYFKIKLFVEKHNQQILKSMVFDKSGTIHTYSITNQIPNIKYADGFFVFNIKKHPGIELIDLRDHK